MTDHTIVGELLTSDQPRDAIHIAVASVVAATKLDPGQSIGFIDRDNTTEVGPCEHAMSVGIVDPFLTQRVHEGQRFWMFLHPNTITSLRHNWTHPAFGGNHEQEKAKNASELWMANFANGFGVPMEDMVNAGHNWLSTGSHYCEGGTFEGETVPDEYWDHFQIITGKKVPGHDRQSFFTCSC